MHLNQSLATETRIQAICNSHEQASAICAEGYAKASNGLGVCMVTTGPTARTALSVCCGFEVLQKEASQVPSVVRQSSLS